MNRFPEHPNSAGPIGGQGTPWCRSFRSLLRQSMYRPFRFFPLRILQYSALADGRQKTGGSGRQFPAHRHHIHCPGNRYSPGISPEIWQGHIHLLPWFPIHQREVWKLCPHRSPAARHRSARRACGLCPAVFSHHLKYRPEGNNAADGEYPANSGY